MARPREFDEEEVLTKATETFWEHGYNSCSIAQLMEAPGLAKGSVYKAFGDKRELFLRTLDGYMELGLGRVRDTLNDAPSASEGIERWIQYVAQQATDRGPKRGCYVVNCIIELAPHDEEIRKRLVSHTKRVEKLYAAAVKRGIDMMDCVLPVDPATAARLISVTVNGLQVSGKAALSRNEAQAVAGMVMAALR